MWRRVIQVFRRLIPSLALSVKAQNGFAMFDEAARAVEVISVFRVRIDAHSVKHRAQQIVRMDRIRLGIRSKPIGFAVNLPRPHSRAGDHRAVTFGPMVPATRTDIVRSGSANLR